jgi:GNAT superfamily N-acetyltransferase
VVAVAEPAVSPSAVALPAQRVGGAPAHVALVGGRVAVIRRATRADIVGARGLHLKCGPETLRDRYLGAPPGLADADLAGLVDPPGGCALVACAGTEVIGLAQVFGGPPVAEIAVLVRDDHQQRGLGTMLARRAVDAAAALGCRDMVAYGVAGSPRLSRLLGRLELRSQLRCEGPMMTLRAPISGGARLRIVH